MRNSIFNFQFSIFNSLSSKSTSGQALITLLFFVLIGFSIISAAAAMIFNNTQAASVTEQGNYAKSVAESGIEEALIRLLRDPNYSGTAPGQPLSINGASVEIQILDGTIIATGTHNNVVRKIEAQTVYNNNILEVISWKEVD